MLCTWLVGLQPACKFTVEGGGGAEEEEEEAWTVLSVPSTPFHW